MHYHRTKDKLTPLHAAVLGGNKDCVIKLIEVLYCPLSCGVCRESEGERERQRETETEREREREREREKEKEREREREREHAMWTASLSSLRCFTVPFSQGEWPALLDALLDAYTA